MEYMYSIYWHTYSKILKSVKWIKNIKKYFEIVVTNVSNLENHYYYFFEKIWKTFLKELYNDFFKSIKRIQIFWE